MREGGCASREQRILQILLNVRGMSQRIQKANPLKNCHTHCNGAVGKLLMESSYSLDTLVWCDNLSGTYNTGRRTIRASRTGQDR